jgi:molybdate transport system regulatory protein
VRPKVKVWVVFSDRLKFGDGRARLLQEIDELGSLRQAAARFDMSYRNAWGYLRELEHAAGFKLLERTQGRGPESGMRLTPRGRQFLARYRKFRAGLDELVTRRFSRAFKDSSPRRSSGGRVPSPRRPAGVLGARTGP